MRRAIAFTVSAALTAANIVGIFAPGSAAAGLAWAVISLELVAGALAAMLLIIAGGMWLFATDDRVPRPVASSAAALVVLGALAGVAAVRMWAVQPPHEPPPSYVAQTKVVAVRAAVVTYVVQRDASGGDTIGYADADFISIGPVSRDGECFHLARVGGRLPEACELEVR